jgi:hypothetical protein
MRTLIKVNTCGLLTQSLVVCFTSAEVKVKGKVIPLHAMEALGVRGASTHS